MSVLTCIDISSLWYILCLKIFVLKYDVFQGDEIQYKVFQSDNNNCIDGHQTLHFFKWTNFIYRCNNKPQNLFTYYDFSLKLFIPLNFRTVIRGSKTNLFPEHLVFLILHDIEEDHLRHYPISETE